MENFFLRLSIMLVPVLMAITCHEVSHGFIADKFGDNTARFMGRLTLNPLKHLDILGTLMFFVFGIGWAKPVPVNFNNLKHPKRDMIWVAAAGPITNLILATISAMVLRVIASLSLDAIPSYQMFLEPILLMLAFFVYINFLLAIFNMIPIPPLDGGRVAVGLLPDRQAAAFSRIEPYGILIIIVLVFYTGIFSHVILPIMNVGIQLLAGPYSNLVFNVTQLLVR